MQAQRARLAAAAIGVQVLEQLHSGNGWLGVQVSYDELGARLGLSDKGAARAIQTAIERRWLVRLSGGRGTAGRYRLPSTIPAALAAQTDDVLCESVEAIAQTLDGGEDALAVLIRSAEHPAWSALGGSGRAWGIAVAQAAGQDPTVVIGSAQRTVRSTLKAMAEVGLDHRSWTGDSVREALDRVADQSDPTIGLTPRAVRAAAIRQQRERAAARAEEVRAFAAVREAERSAARAEKGAAVQEPAQAPAEPVSHASGELRVDLPPNFDPSVHGPAFKANWAGRGYTVVGVRLGHGHSVLKRVPAAARTAA
ncbi:hypothetical protein [Sanguibacter sp. Leaf3]|uniref:hypothetical protein n=1 Tax=Sanguibacter sp. Leaf3 TaxID=1736209 RepID=UPI0006FCE5DF|nr:hypothetical protein [Sanguibacter sp. Leaf3]KQT98370.1 hypothetical protein ASG53_11965 [Sanguibacter sp. Leaf3]